MNTKRVFSSIGVMVVFGAIGLTQFTEHVRTVQVIGLCACGAVVGAALSVLVAALRNKPAGRG